MDAQAVFNAVLTVASLLGGVMLKSILDAIKDLRVQDNEISERINELPSVYMRRDDFMAFGQDIKATLIRIETKLDSKADK